MLTEQGRFGASRRRLVTQHIGRSGHAKFPAIIEDQRLQWSDRPMITFTYMVRLYFLQLDVLRPVVSMDTNPNGTTVRRLLFRA